MVQQQKAFSSEKNKKRPSANNLSYLIKRNWYWFFISVIICLGLAFLYISYSPKIHTHTAFVLIKDNISSLIHNPSAEHPIEIKKDAASEAFVLKSKQLMQKAVRRLNLDINYTIKEGLCNTELYTHSPIIVSFPEASETDQFSFVATPVSENKIQLSYFSNNQSKAITINLKENNTISTPLGKIKVNRSIHYGNKYFNIPITIIKKNMEEVAQYYHDKLNVRIPEKSASVIEISLDDISATRSADIINTLIAIYSEEAINEKDQIIVSTLDFINEQMLSIKKELDNSETKIDTVQSKIPFTDVNPAIGMHIRSSNLNNQVINDLQNKKILARDISDYILDPKRSSGLIPAYTISDHTIEKQITEYNNLIIRRSKLISSNNAEPQAIEDLNKSLAMMKQNIIRDIGNFILRTDNKIREIRELEPGKIPSVPTQQKPVSPIESDFQQKNKESLYLYLSKKREDNTLLQTMVDSDIQILDSATGSEKPASPETIYILLAVILAGIVLPAILLWLKSILNTTVRNRKNVEDILSIPFLGEIPLQKKHQPGDIVVREDSHEPISEAFRIIRTNIEVINKTQGSKVIMLTSFAPGAGKTFVSDNLAVSFALIRKKVILVDLDMRKGTLSSYINKGYAGISTFLSGKTNNINEIITKKVFYETLDFIPAGPIPQNPSELLLSNRFDILIQDLKKHYDYIILDNATSNMVADATIVNRISDLSVFVIRADKTDRRQLPELEKQYQNNKYNHMHIILNGVNQKQFGYGYANQ